MRALLADAWEGIRAAPGRHALSLFALAAGLAVLTLGAAVRGGLESRALAIETSFGPGSFALPAPGDAVLSTRQEDIVRHALPGGAAAAVRAEPATVAGMPGVAVTACGADLAAIKAWRVSAGRFLDARDLAGRARVAVLSGGLARRAGKRPGDLLAVGRDAFVVVGVVETGTTPEEGVWAVTGDRVFIPHTTPGSWHRQSERLLAADALLGRPAAGIPVESALPPVLAALASPPAAPEGIAPVTAADLSRRARELGWSIAWGAGAAGVLALVLGGAALGSMAAASVAARTGEIGLRRALGATPGDILSLFITEGALVSVAALLLALGGAWGLLAGAGDRLPVPVEFTWAGVAAPALLALFTAAVATVPPALRAARIPPAEALRAE